MNQANSVFIVTLAIILFGYVLKKLNYVSEKEGKILSKLLMHTTFPALILSVTLRLKFEPSLVFLPFINLIEGIVLLIIGWFVFKKYPQKERGILTMGTSGFNVGLFVFPIIEGIWGREGLVYAIMYDIGNAILTFCFVYPIGFYFSANEEKSLSVKMIVRKAFNVPPFQALFIGLIINALGVTLPDMAMDFLDVLAKANKALVLLLMGIYLNFILEKSQIQGILKVLCIRYIVALICVAILYFMIPSSMMQSVLIACVVLPAGLTLIPFADELNLDTKIAGFIVNSTLILSFLLLWGLILGLGLV